MDEAEFVTVYLMFYKYLRLFVIQKEDRFVYICLLPMYV